MEERDRRDDAEKKQGLILDYRSPSEMQPRQERHPKGEIFILGVGLGYFISIVCWFGLLTTSRAGNTLVIGATFIVLIKAVLAILCWKTESLRGLSQGLLASIALVPLTGFCLLSFLCGFK